MRTRRHRSSTIRSKFKWARSLGYSFILMFTLLIYLTTIGQGADQLLQDAVYAHPKPIDTHIIVLGIDDESLKAIGSWPWPRSTMAQLIDVISSGKPSAIGIDVLFSEPSADPAEDHRLAQSIRDAGNVVLPMVGHFSRYTETSRNNALHAESFTLPLSPLLDSAILGHISIIPDEADGVVRHYLPSIESGGVIYPSFAEALYTTATGTAPDTSYVARRIDFIGRPNEYGHISVSEVLSGHLDPAYFKDAIVLIGPLASGIVDDYYTTPIDRQSQMAGIEIHANILQNIIDERFKSESVWMDLSMILLVYAVLLIASKFIGPVSTAFALFIVGAVYIAAAKGLYAAGHALTLLYPLFGAGFLYLYQLVMHNLENYNERKRITSIFGKYVAPEVVNEILRTGEEDLRLGGSKREVTMLFVDVRGFTPLSERTDPETLVQILNDYLQLTAISILHHKGTLDKFIGDATMAIFNAPLDLPDHELAAIRAALEMRQGAAELNRDLNAKYGVHIDFGIGIYSGTAIIGNIGAKFRMDYTAIGDTVNTAARLESVAKAGEILISEEQYLKLQPFLETEYRDELQLKGKEHPMKVYRIISLKADTTGKEITYESSSPSTI